MSYILSIDTATSILSIAIHEGGVLKSSVEHDAKGCHDRLAIDSIHYMLQVHSMCLQDLDALAISTGPGSYTGLKIGASLAKGMCVGAQLPLIGVNTLACMIAASQNYPIEGLYIALLDARHENAYTLVADSKGDMLEPIKKYRVTIDFFEGWLHKHRVYFIGDGAEKYAGMLAKHRHTRFIYGIYPHAKYMGKLAYDKFLRKEFIDIADFEPIYEVELAKKL